MTVLPPEYFGIAGQKPKKSTPGRKIKKKSPRQKPIKSRSGFSAKKTVDDVKSILRKIKSVFSPAKKTKKSPVNKRKRQNRKSSR